MESVSQELESYLRTKWVSEEIIEFILRISNCPFVVFETPLGVSEMTDFNRTLSELVNISVFSDDVTIKTILNTNAIF